MNFKDASKARVLATGNIYDIVSVTEQNGNISVTLANYKDGEDATLRVQVGDKIFVEPVLEKKAEPLTKPLVENTLLTNWLAAGLPKESFEVIPEEDASRILERLKKKTTSSSKNWRDKGLGTYWRKGEYVSPEEFQNKFGFDGLEVANEFVKILAGVSSCRKPQSILVNTNLIDGIKITSERLLKLLEKINA